jgi:hypothetical protein
VDKTAAHLTLEELEYGHKEVIGEEIVDIILRKEIFKEEERLAKVFTQKILSVGRKERGDRDARHEERQTQERPQRKKGHEQKAGRRHRTLRSKKGRQKSSGEETVVILRLAKTVSS